MNVKKTKVTKKINLKIKKEMIEKPAETQIEPNTKIPDEENPQKSSYPNDLYEETLPPDLDMNNHLDI